MVAGATIRPGIKWDQQSNSLIWDAELEKSNKLSFAMISLRLEKFLNGVWNLYQNFHMITALVLGFGILILIWIWSPVFDTPMIRFSALYLDFEGAKTIHVP